MHWFEIARKLQGISQTGLHFTENEYDRERYGEIGEIAAGITAEYSTLEKSEVIDLQAAEFGYATPKVDVRGVVFRDGKILLVKETADNGRWTVPGGWADLNDSPSESVIREIREESGFETVTVKLLAVYDREKHGHEPPFPYHIYKLFFRCRITGGEAATSFETGGVDFFGKDELPELSVSRVTEPQIQRFFEHLEHPGMPTDFD